MGQLNKQQATIAWGVGGLAVVGSLFNPLILTFSFVTLFLIAIVHTLTNPLS